MSNALVIDGKTLQPIKDAALVVSYSRDYVTRLAREEKIVAKLVGRQWFVDIDSLKQYAEASAMEQELRKKRLSEERKQERLMKEAVEEKNTLHIEQSEGMHARAVSVASLVLGLGLVAGWGTYSILSLESIQFGIVNTAQISQQDESDAIGVSEDTAESMVHTPAFAQRSIDTLPSDNGVLLIPNASSSTVEELFSDEVVVVHGDDGSAVVNRVDENGEVVGNEVPFVIVPITEEQN